MQPFDVVLTPFPFVDRPEEKLRPAVVVSTPDLLAAADVLWMVMVTSTQSDRIEGDVSVSDLEGSGLQRPCRVRTSKMFALHRSRIVRRLGQLGEVDARAVARAASNWLAPAP